MADFEMRLLFNAPGRFYIDETCLDCGACREAAPGVFARNDTELVSYVARQPTTPEENEAVYDAIEGCPCGSIGDDGDRRDWSLPPRALSRLPGSGEPWWKLW